MLKDPSKDQGEWIPVSTYSEIMGITKQRVYQKIKEESLTAIAIEEYAQKYPQDYLKIGRGPSQAVTMLVWLDDEDCG